MLKQAQQANKIDRIIYVLVSYLWGGFLKQMDTKKLKSLSCGPKLPYDQRKYLFNHQVIKLQNDSKCSDGHKGRWL